MQQAGTIQGKKPNNLAAPTPPSNAHGLSDAEFLSGGGKIGLSDAEFTRGGGVVGPSSLPRTPARGVDNPTRDMNAAQLGDTLSAEALATLLEPFSLRGGKGEWKVPDVVHGAAGILDNPIGGAVDAVVTPVYDFIKSFSNPDPRAKTSAATNIATQTVPGIAGLVEGVKGARGFEPLPSLKDIAKPVPELTFLRNIPGLAIDVESKLKPAMSAIKDGEAITGKVTKDVPTALDNLSATQNDIHRHIDSVIRGQEDVVVPGSRQAQINAQIKAIPETYVPGTAAYKKLVRKIVDDAGPNDYTIGQLNRQRKALSATQSPYYGKDIQGQLTMETGPRAADIARGNLVREQFYDSLNDNGFGGKEIVREGNARLGAIMELQDILGSDAFKNKARLQAGQSSISKVTGAVGKLARPGETAKEYARGEGLSINEDIASALRRWQTSKPLGEFATGLRPGPEPPRNAANELIMTHKPQVMGLPAVIPPETPPTHVMAYPIGDSRFPMPESSITKDARFNRALTTGQKLLPAAGDTSVKVTPQAPESFSEAMHRTDTAQSQLMRETMGKGPFDKQARPATADEYLRTKGGTDMPNTPKYEAKSKTAPKPEPPKKSTKGKSK